MRNTGGGLHGIAHSNYQDWVIDKVCKYYLDLLPVLGSRPNVQPAFTNEDDFSPTEDKGTTNQNENDSDVESLFEE